MNFNDKISYLLIYTINPFVALLREIKHIRNITFPYVLMFFCAFYGASQFFGEEGVRYKDASTYRDNFYKMHDNAFTWENFKSSLFDGETTFDVAIPLVSYVISSFTGNAKVFFFVCGLIFGYFYSKNITFIIQNLDIRDYDRFLVFLIVVFVLVIPFWSGLNGLRMWTGGHVFFYGVSRTLEKKNYGYLTYIALAVLFHFAYIAVAGVFCAFCITPFKRYNSVFFGMFVLTFLIAEANVGIITELVKEYSPAAFQVKTESYTKEVYVETFKENNVEGRSWHAVFHGTALLYSMFYLTLITYFFNLREKLLNATQKMYFSFALILFSFANIVSQLPSGGRFYKVAYLVAFIPITYFYSKTKNKRMFHFTLFPILFWMIVNIRDGCDQITLATFIANPILVWFDLFNQVPLIDYIK